ncbi:DC-STAMP domain-containing protein 2-like [Anopheles ziemanni]|uniref:DC-STAMP domain-containing protein 2-like n=1 Tax=Anopheles coustani TaxID=139045 RepID=UPI002659562B|nr:DC-STAMP domain-containing protein 2-like [Anopheles coustani]XP_058178024.1 DC-STAMP domain-containing protein 2-like [Anopheles ziemanni]
MWRRGAKIVALGITQTVIVNSLVLNQFVFQRAVYRLLVGLYFLVAIFALARKKSVRCITVLLVPQFLSKRGRAALIGYIFLLTVTGPTENTMRNVEVLGGTLSCTQEQLKTAIHDTLTALKVPFLAMKQIVGELLQTVERSFMKVQQTLMEVLKLTKRILRSIKAAYDWLRDVVSVCNDKMGTPSDRCLQFLERTIDACMEEMGSMDFLCEVTQVGKTLCYGAKMVDYFCELIDFVSDAIVDEIEQGIQRLIENMKDLFRVRVEYEHGFDFSTNASKSFAEVVGEIKEEIAERSLPLRRTFNIIGVLTSGFFVCILLRTIRYRDRYLRKDDFDNKFLTEDFYAIDARRVALNIATVFPLTRKERNRYIPLISYHLTWNERWRILKSVSFMLLSTIQIGGLVFADYALYWSLTLIKHFMREESEHPNNSSHMVPLAVGISGEGILADTLRDIVRSFDPIANGTAIDPSRCIPEASAPRFERYWQILLLLVLCWLFAVLEPYGLRVRQIVMRRYYPYRARARALWLYGDMMLKRESLWKVLRRQLSGSRNQPHRHGGAAWWNVLRAKTNHFWICRKLLGLEALVRCTLCGEGLNESEDGYIECPRSDCAGRYCPDCFLETANSCSLCLERLLNESNSHLSNISLISFE